MTELLTPPDLKRCQTEIHNGCGPFSMGGISKYERCIAKASYIAYELKPAEDGQMGAMSLCLEHKDIFISEQCNNINNYKFAKIL